jgi:lysophospholipase L1-like esterase
MLLSDPADLEVPALSDLAISIYFPSNTAATTSHFLALQTSYVSPATGDATALVKFSIANTTKSWPFLSAVDVLAARLQNAAGRKVEMGVLNEGIIGNRLLRGSPRLSRKQYGAALGQAGLMRFERAVLDQSGVRYVIVRLGVNDIGFPGSLASATERVSTQSMISGYRQLIAQGRRRGIRVIGTTITPFEGAEPEAGYYTAEKEAVRQEINDWICSGAEFDAVIDFDMILRDPSRPTRLLPSYDSGDHLHPNDAGYSSMSNAIPLALFGIN